MEERRKKKERNAIEEHHFNRLVRLLERLRNGIELLYYLLDHYHGDAFVVALISAREIDLVDHIQMQKRKTDILYEIDASENLYALLCQGTGVDGGYYFIQRLVQTLQERGGKSIYCSELEISSSRYPIFEIVSRLDKMYQRAREHNADGEISFYALD